MDGTGGRRKEGRKEGRTSDLTLNRCGIGEVQSIEGGGPIYHGLNVEGDTEKSCEVW